MRIIIAGGHGKIALRLAERLKSGAVGIVRNPAHVADVEATGAEAVVCDLEKAALEEVTEIVEGADAVVFAA
ncbi:NAD(P)H-binding protein, partial [Nonomuraea sp. NPDC049784]|uniref:NAD(P)H-binding protein n=1 Tax=Nonomuraea sp. NPDC049784 TaxID=3154361 RepID=UPI0033F1FA4C